MCRQPASAAHRLCALYLAGSGHETSTHTIVPRSRGPIRDARYVMPVSSQSRPEERTAPKRKRVPPRFVVHVTLRLRRFLLGVADRFLPAQIALLEHAHSFTVVHLLAAFAELGVADHLADGPKTAKELAGLVQSDADALHRALRAAAVVGIVRLDAAGKFHATRLTTPLRSHDPSATADWCRYIGSPSLQGAWSDLTQTLRTGESAFRR